MRLDPHDAGGLRRAEPHGEDRAEHDRHLAEDVPGETLADHARDPVDLLDRLDTALEQGEERALVALVRRVLARHEADVRRQPGKLLALGLVESRKELDCPISSAVTTFGASKSRSCVPPSP